MTPTAKKMLDGLLGLAANDRGNLLRSIFDNDASFAKHLQKRMERGEILSEQDYAEKTFGVLANAATLTVVLPARAEMLPTGKMRLTNGAWIVLLGERGNVITSHPFRPDLVQFEQRHEAMGDDVDDQSIPKTYRDALARVFGSR